MAAENRLGCGIESIAVPLALDDIDLVTPMGHHEVHFTALLAAPIAHRRVGEMRLRQPAAQSSTLHTRC